MALQKAMVSSKSSEWGTPQDFFDFLDKEFHFTLDPCADERNAKCQKYYSQEQDGLKQNWSSEVVFVNPPYARGITEKWVRKAYEESLKGAIVVMLLSVGTGRSYWHEIIFPYAAQFRWVRGFLKFQGAPSTAPFGSVILVFDKDPSKYPEKYIYNFFSKGKKRV